MDLSRGSVDLSHGGETRVNWRVMIVSGAIIVAFSVWTILAPVRADEAMLGLVQWLATNLGWVYVVTVASVILFILYVAFSREGSVRLGPDHSRPQYGLFTWVAMLFAAGVGIDLLFYAVAEPVSQYYTPPTGDGRTPEAAADAVVWSMFHYGIGGWAMYALLGMAFGYFAYRWNMPLSIRSALYPLLGKRVKGAVGDAAAVVSLLGTIFGVAASMGIGVVLLNVGLELLFGLPQSAGVQIGLVVVAVIMTIAACASGVDKGIRIISELNIWMALVMLLYILATGQTAFLLNATVQNIGQFVSSLPGLSLETMAYQQDGPEWMASWTLFFWAFWMAWGPFVGLFLARISRGRTLREFVIGAITAPVLFDLLIVTIFGNSALWRVMNGDDEFGALAVNSPEEGWYALLQSFPGAPLLIGLATISGMLFYLTSANSGAMVMSNFSSYIRDPGEDGPKWLRIFWAILTALLTVAMLLAGGIPTLQHATLIFALPVSVLVYLVMASFWKTLRIERAQREGFQAAQRSTAVSRVSGGGDLRWRRRLSRLRAYPGRKNVAQFSSEVVEPALREVTDELVSEGYDASLTSSHVGLTGIQEHTLVVAMGTDRDFYYQVYPVATPIPRFGPRVGPGTTDVYYRLVVFSQTGTEGTDLMDRSTAQIITDVVDRYEAHLQFLTIAPEGATGAVVMPHAGLPDWNEDFPVEKH